MSREYMDKGIRINRSQRRWHRYGGKILAICIAAAAAIAIIAIAANIGKSGGSHTASGGNSSSNGGNNSSAVATTASGDGDKTETTSVDGSGSAATETGGNSSDASSSGKDKGGTVSGKAKEEEFTSGDFYEDAAFIGDIFVYGIDEYEFIDSSNLYSATFMTAAKAKDLVEDVSSLKPGKIFVMLGFDDDNLAEDRSAEASADSILELLEELKSSNPNAKIYAVSEIPVSEDYDANGGDYVTQADLDEINALVKKGAESLGIGYIDVAESLKEGGFLSADYSNDGCHVMKQYYPFVLNGIASAAE